MGLNWSNLALFVFRQESLAMNILVLLKVQINEDWFHVAPRLLYVIS
jgi:hypothetical protein